MTRTNLSTAEKLISRYPWYTLGYVDVYEEICRMDPDSIGIYLSKAAARVYSRKCLYEFYQKHKSALISGNGEVKSEAVSLETDDVSRDEGSEELSKTSMSEIDLDEIDFVPDDMPRFVLAGGDYFSRKDLEQLELDKEQPLDQFIAEKPTLLRGAAQGKQPSAIEEEVSSSDFFDDASFYTETLANIYTEQGFYKRAIDVYAKLILLYPEKSSYFASLVSKLKKKYNI